MRNTTVHNGRRLVKVVALMLISLGLLAIILPTGFKLLAYNTANRIVDSLEKRRTSQQLTFLPVNYQELPLSQPIIYTEEEFAEAAVSDDVLDELEGLVEGDTALATALQTSADTPGQSESYLLEIPSIALKVAAFRTVSFADVYQKMRYGAAFFPKSPELKAVGNICICAHRTGARDYFSNLNHIAIGDKIFLHTMQEGSYCYEVQTVQLIQPDDWSVTDSTTEPVITLLSCQAYRGVSHGLRIMVRAKLIAQSSLPAQTQK